MNEERHVGIFITIGVIFIGVYAMYRFYQNNINYFQNINQSEVIEGIKPNINTYINSLEDSVSETQKLAAIVLGKILLQNLPNYLKGKLKSTNLGELQDAVKEMDRLLPKVGPSLKKTMKDKNAEVRTAAAMALGKVCPMLLVLTVNKNIKPDVRQSIIEVLVELGQESVSSLVKALKELCSNSLWANSSDPSYQNQFIRSFALNDISTTLVKIGSQSIFLRNNVLHAIQPGLRSKNTGLVLVSTWIAIRLDPVAQSCIQPIIKLNVNTENLFDVLHVNLLLKASRDLNKCYNIQRKR